MHTSTWGHSQCAAQRNTSRGQLMTSHWNRQAIVMQHRAILVLLHSPLALLAGSGGVSPVQLGPKSSPLSVTWLASHKRKKLLKYIAVNSVIRCKLLITELEISISQQKHVEINFQNVNYCNYCYLTLGRNVFCLYCVLFENVFLLSLRRLGRQEFRRIELLSGIFQRPSQRP